MFENLNGFLVGIALGIRFQPNFTINDQLGRISDEILFSPDSFFNHEVFKVTQSTPSRQQILMNDDNKDRLVIEAENLILEMNFNESDQFNVGDVPEILEAFNNQIIKGILNNIPVERFIRIGYISKYQFTDENFINSILENVTGVEKNGVKDLTLRFSKRLPLGESYAKNEVNNFNNAIFTITKKAEKIEQINISIDFQKFYDPVLMSSLKIDFNKFLSEASYFTSEHFLPWLKSFYLEE
ncbi:MAG: hypothetical protein H0S79_11970 [Anaerolineaceae bacterium]|nr:hypothetical protein [Anaerolineaceae bacterium]